MEVRPFYLNIRLLNKDEMIRSKVEEKAGTGLFAKAAGALASRVVSDDMVVDKLGDILTEKIRIAVDAMGIECDLQKRFQQGPFVCFKVRILSVDQLKLILAAKGEEFAATFSRLLVALTELGLGESALPKINEKISEKVYEGMRKKFQELIPLRMKEQGLEVEVIVGSLEEQSEVFFQMVEKC